MDVEAGRAESLGPLAQAVAIEELDDGAELVVEPRGELRLHLGDLASSVHRDHFSARPVHSHQLGDRADLKALAELLLRERTAHAEAKNDLQVERDAHCVRTLALNGYTEDPGQSAGSKS
mgnify:CR=1 FL=1